MAPILTASLTSRVFTLHRLMIFMAYNFWLLTSLHFLTFPNAPMPIVSIITYWLILFIRWANDLVTEPVLVTMEGLLCVFFTWAVKIDNCESIEPILICVFIRFPFLDLLLLPKRPPPRTNFVANVGFILKVAAFHYVFYFSSKGCCKLLSSNVTFVCRIVRVWNNFKFVLSVFWSYSSSVLSSPELFDIV